ncbi:LLM class flavin-dependent oxidoreductase [Streptomyces sp. SID3343]|uniref:LLM class flavin-dependent oxidoreductase n=1 Tax=Streptomyces sp. SID3343 TaxID=2690260 RepID=UPI00136D95D6|nr:LLM class flavin-dependent oxidoreductase [Streptomyces sp. SID3343]MYW01359.1 LLM class flavin-dependent oxidoreductase [Streptomyces sp. SID3343]
MKFGLNFFPVFDPAERSAHAYFDDCLRLAELADRLGFEHVQTVEHYFSAYGGYCPDPVTLLAAVAARTTRVRVVTGAVIPAFTHPVKLAGKLAMLDNLSHGRLDVGFGRAFLPEEFAAFGIPMEQSRSRFAENVEACRRLWSEEEVVHRGEHTAFGPVTMLPRTVQRPHPPIFVAAATSADSCAAAGAAGHHLQVVPAVTTTEDLQVMLTAYHRARAEAGHAGAGRVQIKYTCYLDDDRETALAVGRHWENNYIEKMRAAVASWAAPGTGGRDYPGYAALLEKVRAYDFARALADNKVLAGTCDDVARQLGEIAEWFGPDLSVSLQFNPGALPLPAAERALRDFAEHVAPKLAHL